MSNETVTISFWIMTIMVLLFLTIAAITFEVITLVNTFEYNRNLFITKGNILMLILNLLNLIILLEMFKSEIGYQ